jgi:hypothetical protein
MYCHGVLASMKESNALMVLILTVLIFELWIGPLSLITAFASIERSALESIDLHLEECIRLFQAGYDKNALSHCEISAQELDAILQNMTATE